MDEFELIRRYFAELTPLADDVALGIGDDCALLRPAPGMELAVTTDACIAGRHFPESTAPADIGWKTLAVNLSDLAAMGAEPRWFTLALSLPQPDETWLAGFAQGLGELAARYGVVLVGGDTTRGSLSVTITAMGQLPAGQALRRSGAKPGDRICVTGTLGDGALALGRLSLESDSDEDLYLRQRLNRPVPRVEAGLILRGIANAAIDLSDGLAGDLGHLLAASGVGAEIKGTLPMSPAFERLAPRTAKRRLQLHGGDDYELCISLPAAHVNAARALLSQHQIALTDIGEVTSQPGLFEVDQAGLRRPIDAQGYRHFA